MKQKNTYTIVLAVLLMASMLLPSGCSRRTLEDDYNDSALIPVRIDWSISGVPVGSMHRASIWLFPHNGGAPLEYHLESDLSSREIAVPVGVYSVLVFNETTEASDWSTLSFTGTDKYETFAAIGNPDAVRGFYSRTEDLPLIMNPEPIAAWSLDHFEVTRDMVFDTRAIVRDYPNTYRSVLEIEIPALTKVKPLPRFERMVITANVTNLSSAMQTTGTIDGMAAGVYMVSGEMVPTSAAHAFILNGRVYEANDKDGTTTRTFNIFGRLPKADNLVKIDFLLVDGTLQPREEFNVTRLIKTQTSGIVRTHVIDLGYNLHGDDHLIALPDMDMSAGISVDGWDEVVIPLM